MYWDISIKVQHQERHLAELSEGPDSKNGKKTVFGKSREYWFVHPEVELLHYNRERDA